MNPLQALNSWYSRLDEEIRADIGFSLSLMLFDGDPLKIQHDEKSLENWLSAGVLFPAQILGRVIRFRGCFEYFFADRFTPEGWEFAQSFHKKIVSEGASDHTSDAAKMAPKSFSALRAISDRIEAWEAIGASWKTLREAHISDEALNVWFNQA